MADQYIFARTDPAMTVVKELVVPFFAAVAPAEHIQRLIHCTERPISVVSVNLVFGEVDSTFTAANVFTLQTRTEASASPTDIATYSTGATPTVEVFYPLVFTGTHRVERNSWLQMDIDNGNNAAETGEIWIRYVEVTD
jgi:hypothetical protein